MGNQFNISAYMRTNLAIIATVAAVCAEAHMPMANLLE